MIAIAIKQQEPSARIITGRTLNLLSPALETAASKLYLDTLHRRPELWRLVYRSESGAIHGYLVARLLGYTLAKKVKNFIIALNPHVVVCTHAFSYCAMASLKVAGMRIPIVGAITDYDANSCWYYGNADCCLVPAKKVTDQMIQQGIEPNQIYVTDIPIDPAFTKREDKRAIRRHLGLSEVFFTILIMGGGLGLGPLTSIIETLNKLDCPIQMLAVAGKNQETRQEIEDITRKLSGPVKVYGCVDNIHQLMKAIDLLVTKPGGLTISEALAKGVPMITISPLLTLAKNFTC